MRDFDSARAALLDKLSDLADAPAPGRLLRLQVAAPDFPPPAWMAAQAVFPKLCWCDRRGESELALVGSLLEIRPDAVSLEGELQALQALLDQAEMPDGGELRCFGGMAFAPEGEAWPEFGYSRWLLPLIERGRARAGCWLACHLDGRTQASWHTSIKQARTVLQALVAPAVALSLSEPVQSLQQRPDFDLWQQRVDSALADFSADQLTKVVLARQTRLTFSAPVNPWALLAHWRQRLPQSYQFAFAFAPEQAFVGCSPEQLFRRIDRMIYTEALAGSSARGLTPQEDKLRAAALLEDDKNRVENRLVLDAICQQLEPLTEGLQLDGGLEVLKLARIQHLRHRLRAQLKAGVSDAQLIGLLHPTPAVGGAPRKAALTWLQRHESEARGWYAGVVASLGRRETQAVVAIRSALVEHAQLTLFAGAGIVPGSEALAEWLELDNKIETVMSLFNRA